MNKLILIISMVLFCLGSNADHKPTDEFDPSFGHEFNATNLALLNLERDRIVNNLTSRALIQNFSESDEIKTQLIDQVRSYINHCDDCTNIFKLTENDLYFGFIDHPDKLINYSTDEGVIEVKGSAENAHKIANDISRMDKYIFNILHDQLKLFSPRTDGHLHIGFKSTFANDLLLYRNYLVVMTTISQVFFDLFGLAMRTTPTLVQLENANDPHIPLVQLFKNLIAEFDQTVDWSQKNNPEYVRKMVFYLNYLLRNQIYLNSKLPNSKDNQRPKFQFFNVEHFDGIFYAKLYEDEETVEIRCVPEVSNGYEWHILTALFHNLLVTLKAQNQIIPFEEVIVPKNKIDAIDIFKNFSEKYGTPWKFSKILLDRSPHDEVREMVHFLSKSKEKGLVPILKFKSSSQANFNNPSCNLLFD